MLPHGSRQGTCPAVPSWVRERGFAHTGVLVLIILIPAVGPVALLSGVPEPFDDSASRGQAGAVRGELGDGITNSIEFWQLPFCSSGAFSFHVTLTVTAHVLCGGRAQTGGRLPAVLLRKGEHLQKDRSTQCTGLLKGPPEHHAEQSLTSHRVSFPSHRT